MVTPSKFKIGDKVKIKVVTLIDNVEYLEWYIRGIEYDRVKDRERYTYIVAPDLDYETRKSLVRYESELSLVGEES